METVLCGGKYGYTAFFFIQVVGCLSSGHVLARMFAAAMDGWMDGCVYIYI
jgi:hypothetical protein